MLSVNAFAKAGIAKVIRWAVFALVAFPHNRRDIASVTTRSRVSEFVARPFYQLVLSRSIFLLLYLGQDNFFIRRNCVVAINIS